MPTAASIAARIRRRSANASAAGTATGACPARRGIGARGTRGEGMGDKEDRAIYVDSQARRGLAIQIRAMRKNRGWTEAELGRQAKVSELAITALEAGAYPNITLPMLKRLASVFDVALTVRLAPFSELINWSAVLDRIAIPPFGDAAGRTDDDAD